MSSSLQEEVQQASETEAPVLHIDIGMPFDCPNCGADGKVGKLSFGRGPNVAIECGNKNCASVSSKSRKKKYPSGFFFLRGGPLHLPSTS